MSSWDELQAKSNAYLEHAASGMYKLQRHANAIACWFFVNVQCFNVHVIGTHAPELSVCECSLF